MERDAIEMKAMGKKLLYSEVIMNYFSVAFLDFLFYFYC